MTPLQEALTKKYGAPQETLTYRGVVLELWFDSDTCQYCIIWDGAALHLGKFNSTALQDYKYLVDRKLDDIWISVSGARLTWFANGYSGFRDIKLEYKTRIIKVWPVNKTTVVDLGQIKNEASELISKICN